MSAQDPHPNGEGWALHLWDSRLISRCELDFGIPQKVNGPSSAMSPEEVEARPPQRGNLHGSRPPGKFPSKSPQLSMVPSPHGPSPLRHGSTPGLPGALRYTSTPGLPTTTPSSSASFSVVVEPLTSAFARQGFGSPYTTVKNRGRPFQNPPTTPGQPIAKKQGPPFRTPKTAAAAASRAAHDESTVRPPKKPARPFKYPQKPRKVAAVVPPEPKFVLFVCEWKNCPAELHNLDTLQAHLITVHLKNQSSVGRLMCLWRKCSQLSYMAVNDRRALEATDRGVKFETKEEWLNHVRTHLDHVARYQGDGPKTELCKFWDS